MLSLSSADKMQCVGDRLAPALRQRTLQPFRGSYTRHFFVTRRSSSVIFMVRADQFPTIRPPAACSETGRATGWGGPAKILFYPL